MSTIYIGERQSGKTTMLIEMSEKTGATIVVATYPMAKYIQLLAARMGKKIPVPITVLLNSKMVFAVLTLFLSSSAMRRTPISVHL